MIVTPLTELDAINEMLLAIGESVIASLEEVSSNVDATTAQKLLEGISRETQQKGWDFNTISSITLVPDANTGKIRWDDSLLRVGSTYRNRGGYFFDVSNDTDVFTSAVTISSGVRLIPFEEMPDVFRRYVTLKASSAFASRCLGDAELEQTLAIELQQSYADMMTYEMETQKPNIFSNTSITEVGTR